MRVGVGEVVPVGGVANANISTGFSRNGIFGMDFLVVGSYRKKRVPDVECISRTSLRNVKEYRVYHCYYSLA